MYNGETHLSPVAEGRRTGTSPRSGPMALGARDTSTQSARTPRREQSATEHRLRNGRAVLSAGRLRRARWSAPAADAYAPTSGRTCRMRYSPPDPESIGPKEGREARASTTSIDGESGAATEETPANPRGNRSVAAGNELS